MKENVNKIILISILILSIISVYFVSVKTSYYEILFENIVWSDLRNMLLFIVISSLTFLVYSMYKNESVKGLVYGSVVIFAVFVSIVFASGLFFLLSDFTPNLALLYFYSQILSYFVLLGFSLSSNVLFRQLNSPKRKAKIISQTIFNRFIGMSVVTLSLFLPVLVTGAYSMYSLFLFLILNLFIGYSLITLINFIFAKIIK